MVDKDPCPSEYTVDGVTFRCLRDIWHDGKHGWEGEIERVFKRKEEVLRALDRATLPQPKPVTSQPIEQRNYEQGDLMAINVSAGSTKEYTPAPAGLHNGVCVDVVDLGEEPNKFYNSADPKSKEKVHKIRIIWALDEDNPDRPGEQFTVAAKFTASINKKASLRKFLLPWRGRDFTEAEEKAFDLEKLIGVPCMIQVLHNAGPDGIIYANVSSVLPLQKGGKALKVPSWYVRVKDRPSREAAGAATTDADGTISVPF